MMKTRAGKWQIACGEIWQANLNPIVGHEQGGTRPVMIVSGEQFNQRPHGLCVIAPITSRVRNIPTHVLVDTPDGGLTVRSVVMCDQLRTISLDRLHFRRGKVGNRTLAEVRVVIRRVFDI